MRRKRENLRFSGQSQANDMLLLFQELTSKSLGTSGSGRKKITKLEQLFYILKTFCNMTTLPKMATVAEIIHNDNAIYSTYFLDVK